MATLREILPLCKGNIRLYERTISMDNSIRTVLISEFHSSENNISIPLTEDVYSVSATLNEGCEPVTEIIVGDF